MLGGEPFVWRPLLDVAERHPQSVFMVFTNGTMINDRVADRILEVGNVSPVISIEGSRQATDQRRGQGALILPLANRHLIPKGRRIIILFGRHVVFV
ncbi:MAG: hypothetical protein N3A66_01655, partial [Planctomycetota bacterium]|nr:hypothetical protein [Planctomycetota bacterium]